MLIVKILIAWFALSLLFAVGWGRWQRRMERYDAVVEKHAQE